MPIAPLLLCGLGCGGLVLSWTYGLWSFGSPGPGLMPAAASMLLVCAGAADVRLVALKRWTPSRRLLSHILALVALPLASLALGMLAALAVYAIVVLFLVERLSLRTTVGITVLAIGGCWLLFEKLLSVPLPRSFFL